MTQIDHQILHKALQNGRTGPQPNTCSQYRLKADAVVGLLVDRTAPAAQRAAKMLLRRMASSGWTVIEGIHPPVPSGKHIPKDATPHITIEAGGRYHLRVTQAGVIFDITQASVSDDQADRRLDGRLPWAAPGAPNPL